METDFVQLIKDNIRKTYQNNNFDSFDKCDCLKKIKLMNNSLSCSDQYFTFKKSLAYYNQEFTHDKKLMCGHIWNTIDATKLIKDIYLNWSD